MAQVAYSFCISMLHSFWQSCLLVIFYYLFSWLFKQQTPLLKRNVLYILLCMQCLLFIATFSIHYFNLSAPNFFILQAFTLSYNNTISTFTNCLFIGYCAMICYKFFKTLLTWKSFKTQYSTTLQKPFVELKLFTTANAHHLGIHKKVTLWFSHKISTPITFGFFKPIILLPISLVNNISVQQAETLILHELAHIKSNDYLLNWFLLAMETIFFFNPFLSKICTHIHMQRELHCDSTVIMYNYSPIVYAETLFKAAQYKHTTPAFSLAAIKNKNQLLKRIEFFTAKNNLTFKKNNLFTAPFLLILFFVLFIITLVTLKPFNTSSPSAKEIMLLPTFGINTDLPTFSSIENAQPITIKPIASKKENKALVKTTAAKVNVQQVQITEPINNDIANVVPVSFSETVLPSTQQIIIKEESSGGNSNATVKVYNVVLQNGVWKLQPAFMLSKTDTLDKKWDSTEPMQIKKSEITQ